MVFPVNNEQSKIGAGWMLETLGFRGKDFGPLLCYPGNAMVIVNKGGATKHDLESLIAHIQKSVRDMFGVEIEPEPIMFG